MTAMPKMKRLLAITAVVSMTVNPLIGNSVAIAAAAPDRAADNVQKPDPKTFPFHNRAIQFRFNQGFFDLGGELIEGILKQSGVVDETNTARLTVGGLTHRLQYEKDSFKARLALQPNKLSAGVRINIVDSEFFIPDHKGCSIILKGPMAFDVNAILSPGGAVDVGLDKNTYDDSGLKIEKKGCGFFLGLGINLVVHDKLEGAILEAFNSVFNGQELLSISRPPIDEALKSNAVVLNQFPQWRTTAKDSDSKFEMDLGIRGRLSNASGPDQVSIGNPATPYLNQMGFQWALDAGFQAVSQNTYNTLYLTPRPPEATTFPDWGLAPFTKTKKAIDFDAGVMIKESFVLSLFSALYQAGFFNIQLQDSLLNKSVLSISPLGRTDALQVFLPDGQPLTKDNYVDSRIEMVFIDPPTMQLKDNSIVNITVPDFQMTYIVKAKGIANEIEALKVRAKFNLVAAIGFDTNGKLSFSFNQKPIQQFVVLSKNGVGRGVTDAGLQAQLNKDVTDILKKVSVDIPFMQGRKIEVKYMGVDTRANSPESNSLSIYLKAK